MITNIIKEESREFLKEKDVRRKYLHNKM